MNARLLRRGRSAPSLVVLLGAAHLVVGSAGCGMPPPVTNTLRAEGTWESSTCENGFYPYGTPTFRRRRVAITGNRAEQTIEYFNDEFCTMPTVTLRIESTFTAGPESTTVPGAFPVDFTRQRLFITPRTGQLASFLQMMNESTRPESCPRDWTPEVEREVTNFDCFGYPPVATCPREYDLLSATNDRLAFGAQPATGNAACEEAARPTALQSAPLARVTR